MKSVLNRIFSPTPTFFRRVQLLCGAVAAGAGVVVANETLVPEWVQAAKYLLVASLAVAAVVQTTKKS